MHVVLWALWMQEYRSQILSLDSYIPIKPNLNMKVGVWGETCGYWLVATSRITNSSYHKLPDSMVVIGHTTAVRHIRICGRLDGDAQD